MAGSDIGNVDGVPLVREAFQRTVRLVTSARLRASVMASLADDEDELALLAEIEGATSGRLIAEERGTNALTSAELVHGVPHAKFINASFAYAKPREPNRFNPAERGAWYAALAVETCIAEVGHHLTKALADTGDFNAIVEYGEMLASMSGVFADLRQASEHPCLDPNSAKGYPAGNAMAAAARGGGHNGIIYPSVRDSGGTCIAALWPNVVQSVVQGDLYRLRWSGGADFSTEVALKTLCTQS
ncbi:RES family NAD+ phosphorylase [Sphingomonas sp. BIUV-7]|uniref:RES family NAD+ phosphorylase n=1 Tax=Sphingomonas natans TaxID=3063330 RepID=A0ABT8Y8Y8_9SPHN|nr:RES family NAD+ phosphorylase [Sphingomonas sp. BIUV-7]MDO6414313.1 RES family NAD+ phosphorylase [Sphingomonas sp. BIUV-7]